MQNASQTTKRVVNNKQALNKVNYNSDNSTKSRCFISEKDKTFVECDAIFG